MTEPVPSAAGAGTILVVTDTPEDLVNLREQLGGEGYQIVQSWTIGEALELIKDSRPDLILLDVTSPGIEGPELCRNLRAERETEALPVIVIADSAEDHADEVLSIGADGIICRPFEHVELTSRVRSLLRMSELHKRVMFQMDAMCSVNAHLDRLNRELTTRNRELELGMEMARRLQDALLPQRYPRVPGVAFSHTYTPSDTIGGDIFQLRAIDDERAAVFLADVSGHGVRAALITSIVKTVFNYIDLTDKTPSQALTDFNSRFRNVLGPLAPPIHATVVLMYVNGPQRTISLASAGHPSPLLIKPSEKTAAPILGPSETGMACGFIANAEYITIERELTPGDVVLAFTDGVFEVDDADGEEFGLERMQALAAENFALVPRDLIQRVITETTAFAGGAPRADDICLVTAEVL